MKISLVILVGVFLMVVCSTASANVIFSCPSNVAVTSSLVFNCGSLIFDFGHDLHGNPANPLPLGGSVTLKQVTLFTRVDGYPEWDLDFGFPQPAKRTTELGFSLFAPPCCGRNLVEFIGLGMNRSPFGSRGYDYQNESGSNFLITETVTSLSGIQDTLVISGGNVWGPFAPGRAFEVTTTIIDNAGDLTGFNEGFAVPEPQSWTLLGAGLLGSCALRRRRKSGRIHSYKWVLTRFYLRPAGCPHNESTRITLQCAVARYRNDVAVDQLG